MKLPVIMRAARGGYRPGRHKARLAFALALSLLIHGCILSLQFGVAGFGLPGFAMPWWGERRVFSSDLRVRLADVPPAPVVPASPPETASALAPLAVLAPAVATRAVPGRPKPARPQRTEQRAADLPPRETPKPAPAAEQPEIIVQKEAKQETFSVPPPAEHEKQDTPGVAENKPLEASAAAVEEQQAARAQEETERPAKQEAITLEAAKKLEEANQLAEARRLEADKKLQQEKTEREAQELEALRQAEEALRTAAIARQKEAEAQARKQEEAKHEALELEARSKAEEAARRQAAELARQRELEATTQAEELAAKQRAQELAERQRAEALAASQRERERLAAETAPLRAPLGAAAPTAPDTLTGRELAAKALDQLRIPGAAHAELQRPPPTFDFRKPSGRRSIAGGIDRDTRLRIYVENWRAKIERNRDMNYPASARTRPHEDPIVTVAVRNDGSLESVFIHRSSGLREIDDAVRRIAQLYAPYGAFPPDLARVYDVIEIRHIWYFADTLRLLEEIR